VKIALELIGNLNSYKFGIVEDTYKLFAPNRGFSGSEMVSFKLTPKPTPAAMVTKRY